MESKYTIQRSSFLTEGTISLEDIRMSLESTPDEVGRGFDMTSYLNYEATPWIQLQDDIATPSNRSTSGSLDDFKPENSSSRARRGSNSKAKNDPEISRLNQRRRAQNRQSQKQFRERKQRAYDEVVAQLHARDHVIEGLKSEVTVLNLTVSSLQREKQNCLDAVVRLCQSMYEFPPELSKQGKEL